MTPLFKHRPYDYKFVVLALSVIALAPVLRNLSSQTHLIVAALCIGVLGLPHGAADAWLLNRAGLLRGPLKTTAVFAGYIGAALGVILLWRSLPVISLWLFLLLSAWHFGDDESLGLHPVERMATGSFLICAPAFFWRDEVIAIYAALGVDTTSMLMRFEETVFVLAVLILLTKAIANLSRTAMDEKKIGRSLQLLLLAAIAAALPPILYFAIYFCALHAPQHMRTLTSSQDTHHQRMLWPTALALSVIALLLAGVALFGLLEAGADLSPAVTQTLFIGLAALTVPHMILIDGVKIGKVEQHADHQA